MVSVAQGAATTDGNESGITGLGENHTHLTIGLIYATGFFVFFFLVIGDKEPLICGLTGTITTASIFATHPLRFRRGRVVIFSEPGGGFLTPAMAPAWPSWRGG